MIMDDRVKQYVDKQDELEKTLFKELRDLLMKTIPDCHEEFSWGVPVYDKGKFYIAAMKERTQLSFCPVHSLNTCLQLKILWA